MWQESAAVSPRSPAVVPPSFAPSLGSSLSLCLWCWAHRPFLGNCPPLGDIQGCQEIAEEGMSRADKSPGLGTLSQWCMCRSVALRPGLLKLRANLPPKGGTESLAWVDEAGLLENEKFAFWRQG